MENRVMQCGYVSIRLVSILGRSKTYEAVADNAVSVLIDGSVGSIATEVVDRGPYQGGCRCA